MPNWPPFTPLPPSFSHLLATTDLSTIITTVALGGILLGLLVPIFNSVVTIIVGIMGPEMKEKLELLFGNIDAGVGPKGGIVGRVWRIFKRSGLGLGNVGENGVEDSGEYLLVGDDGEEQVGVGGLWNQGNTCYQNSVLQAMASCKCLRRHLTAVAHPEVGEELSESEPRPMIVTLVGLLDTLNRSWGVLYVPTTIAGSPGGSGGAGDWMYNEQQDAQEFYQRLTAGVEKEVGKYCERLKKRRIGLGLGQLVLGLDALGENNENDVGKMGLGAATVESVRGWIMPEVLKNPFEGWVVHRVGCLKCGYVEDIRMQAFTSLSLSLVSEYECTLEDCLAVYTQIERIEQVDCDKCTLLDYHARLQTLLQVQFSSSPLSSSYEATRNQRLEIVNQALEEDDFSPPVFEKLAIPRGQRTSVTKTKQTMLVRTPMVLALHLNRSQFDIQSGMIRKNYAPVKVPMWLDVGAVGVVVGKGGWEVDPGKPISMPELDDTMEEGDASANKTLFELKGLVAHYGGHHNGHYICYRKTGQRWWKISDEKVVGVFGWEVEAVRNAFMCFYERVESVAVVEEYEKRRKNERQMKKLVALANSNDEGEYELAVDFPKEGFHQDTAVKQLIEKGGMKEQDASQSLITNVGVSGPVLGLGGRNFGSDRDVDAVLNGVIFGSVLEANAGVVETEEITNCDERLGQAIAKNSVVREEEHMESGDSSRGKGEIDVMGVGELSLLNVASPNPAPVPPTQHDPVMPAPLPQPSTIAMDCESGDAGANSEPQEKSEMVDKGKLASSPPESGLITSTSIYTTNATAHYKAIASTTQAIEGHVYEDITSGTAAAKTNGDDTKCTKPAPNHKIPRTGKNKKGRKKSKGASRAVKDSKPLGQEGGGESVLVN